MFKAEAVISISGVNSKNGVNPDSSLLSFFGADLNTTTDYAELASKMLGAEFLESFIAENPTVIDDGCAYGRPSIYSVKGMLDVFGIFPIKILYERRCCNFISNKVLP